MKNFIAVESISREIREDGSCRISACVGGTDLWFESSNTLLHPSPEGFASVLLVPAMSHGRDLLFNDPLCPVWLENARKLMEYFSHWWGWKPIQIKSRSTANPDFFGSPEKRTLCFSGGVDSFHTLLTFPDSIHTLVMVHGYDIRLDDSEGGQIAFEHVRQVAQKTGREAVLIKTNYREHPVAGKKYQYAYGGALAGLGHLLGSTSELIISSGMRYDEEDLDGSQWQTDPLWSSRKMKVIHYGAGRSKDEKIRAIAEHPLVQEHLRVCQENWKGLFRISLQHLNCGRCLKCIQTLLVLCQETDAERLKTFKNTADLYIHLNKVRQCKEYLYEPYMEIRRQGLDEKTDRALRALIRRSRILNHLEWTGRRGKKAVFGVLQWYDRMEQKLFCERRSLASK
jgi:hypothetical protein